MKVSRRSFFGAAGMAAAAAASGCAGAGAARPCPNGAKSFAYGPNGRLRVTVPGLAEDVRVFVIGDTHFGRHDARDDAYAGNYARMARGTNPTKAFADTLAKAKNEKPDILLLVGDIISFPTLANVEHVKRELDACGIDWYYVAGNHDWHFEGVPGSDEAQRAEWAPKRLAPLYRGLDPFMSSRLVKGIRFVAIDDSIYHISERQLEFWKAEAAKGDPMVLFMHVPLWLDGWGRASLFTCGNPDWGAATDPYWEIERREKWAEKQSPASFAFRDAVLSTPNLAAVMTGHIHTLLTGCERGKYMFTTPSNRTGEFLDVRFTAK